LKIRETQMSEQIWAYKDKINNLYISLHILEGIKSRWAGHVTRRGKMNAYNITTGNP